MWEFTGSAPSIVMLASVGSGESETTVPLVLFSVGRGNVVPPCTLTCSDLAHGFLDVTLVRS